MLHSGVHSKSSKHSARVHGEEIRRKKEDQTLSNISLYHSLHIHQNQVVNRQIFYVTFYCYDQSIKFGTLPEYTVLYIIPTLFSMHYDKVKSHLGFPKNLNFSVNLYSGALFIERALNWSLYVSVVGILLLTALTTIGGGLTGKFRTSYSTHQWFIRHDSIIQQLESNK